MPARTALALLLLLLVAAGCGGGGGDGPIACARGFRAADWEERRLETGTAAARCGWFRGVRGGEAGRRLGPTARSYGVYYAWDLGEEPGDADGRHRFLRLQYDERTQTITEAGLFRDRGWYRPPRNPWPVVGAIVFALVTAGLLLWLAASGWEGPAGLATFGAGVAGVLVSLLDLALSGRLPPFLLAFSLVNAVTGAGTLLRARARARAPT